MEQVFTSFLLTSAIGTILALVLVLLRPLTRKVFSSAWHYYIWLVVLLVMILPIRLNLPQRTVNTPSVHKTELTVNNALNNKGTHIISEIQSEQVTEEQNVHMQETNQSKKALPARAIKEYLSDKIFSISFIWLAITIFIFTAKITNYIIFIFKMRRYSEPVSMPEVKAYTNRNIRTRISDTICSPLMIGILRPTLLLPKNEFSSEQLHNILSHEMTHFKRKDILYKWFAIAVKSIHWYNPAIYFICNQINIDCEISCDLAVVKNMDKQQEKEYMETILSLLTNNNSKNIPLTTGMTGKKKTLKRRFIMIKKRKSVGTITQIVSTLLAVVILVTTVFTSGVLAANLFKRSTPEPEVKIEVRHNGELLQLKNKPFTESGVMYFPLRELFEKTGLLSDENAYIKWDNGLITMCITEGDDVPEYDESGTQFGTKPIIIQYYWGIEIGKEKIILNPEGTLPEHRQHLSRSDEMTDAPILKDGVTYIPYEYIDYMVNRVMINNKITVWEDEKSTPSKYVDNAENMTYEDIKNLQISADKGNTSWRLDPKQVITSFLSEKGEKVSNIRLPEIASDTLKYVDGDIEMELFKPVDKTEDGIWVVKSYTNTQNPQDQSPDDNSVSTDANNNIAIKAVTSSDSPNIVLSYLTLTSDINLTSIEESLKKSGITGSKDDHVDLTKNYLLDKCQSGDSINTYCDDNGNITLYFNSNENDYVDITFTESQTGEYVAGYGVMPDTSKSYSFMGFERGKEYNIQFLERIPNDINYIIY